MKRITMRSALHRVWLAAVLLGGVYLPLKGMAAPDTTPDTVPDTVPEAASQSPKAPESWTVGDKKLLYIRADFDDRPGEPISFAEVGSVMAQVNAFYLSNSGGQFHITPEITPVLRMPQPAAWYEKRPDIKKSVCWDADKAARAAGYDLDSYQLEIVFCAQLGPTSIGKGTIGRKGMLISGTGRFGTAAHELGHNLGLSHANLWQTDDGSVIGSGQKKEYGNPFDLMGPGAPTNEERALRHISAWSKNYLNWLPDAAVQSVEASGTYRICAHDMPGASGVRALKIKKDGERNYWVEFRQLQTSSFPLMNGALIYWGFNEVNYKNQALLLDMTPGSKAGAKDAPLLIGRTFSDAESGLHITPVGKGGTTPESLDVVVNIGPFPGNAAPQVKLSADSLNVGPGQTIHFQAQASDGDGDALAYSWECSDGTAGGNRDAVTKSWARRGIYRVRCTVSDMKGGLGAATVEVSVR